MKKSKLKSPQWIDAPYECVVGFDLKLAKGIAKEIEGHLGRKLKVKSLRNGLYRIYEP